MRTWSEKEVRVDCKLPVLSMTLWRSIATTTCTYPPGSIFLLINIEVNSEPYNRDCFCVVTVVDPNGRQVKLRMLVHNDAYIMDLYRINY